MADLQDAVAGADAGQRDEADHRRHRERLSHQPEREHAADQGERHVAHDDERQHRRAVAAVEDGEDQGEREPGQGRDGPARLLLRLKGALQAGEEARGQFGLRHLLPDGRHDGGHVALAVGVGLHHQSSAAVLSKDLVRAVGLADVGDLAGRHPARGRLDQQVLQALRRALALGQAQDDVEALVAVGDRRDDATVREAAELLDHRRRLDPVEGGPGVVDPDLQLRDSDLLLDLQVGEPGDLGHPVAQVVGHAPQGVEVLAEDLQGEFGPDTRKHVVEAVRDRLADVDRERQRREASADVGDHRVLAPAGPLELDLDLR